MEARVYYEDGAIEACRIPDYVGGSSTSAPWEGVSESSNDIDVVRCITERFVCDDEGYWLECVIDKPAIVHFSGDGSPKKDGGAIMKRVCIVPRAALGSVKLILLDGEQVYPEANSLDDGRIGDLRYC